MPSVFLDTNIIAYQFDASEPAKQAAARALLQTDREFTISTQVLLELYVVVTRRLKPALPAPVASQLLDTLGRLPVVGADARLVKRAAATAGRHQLSIWDAMVVEAAAEAGCAQVWTEDLSTGAVLRGVEVVNPFLL